MIECKDSNSWPDFVSTWTILNPSLSHLKLKTKTQEYYHLQLDLINSKNPFLGGAQSCFITDFLLIPIKIRFHFLSFGCNIRKGRLSLLFDIVRKLVIMIISKAYNYWLNIWPTNIPTPKYAKIRKKPIELGVLPSDFTVKTILINGKRLLLNIPLIPPLL